MFNIYEIHFSSYCSFSDVIYSMDANFNCSWTSKGGFKVQFALFRGLCFQFYGERWSLKMMKTERKKRKTLQSAFFHVVCGCGGLEKTRQRIGGKSLGRKGGNQLVCWEIWGFVVAPALNGYQQICCSHSTAHISTISKHTCNPHPNTATFAIFACFRHILKWDFRKTDHFLRYQ